MNKHITYKLYIVLLPELVCTLYINIRQIKLLHVYINKLLLLADMKAGGGGDVGCTPFEFSLTKESNKAKQTNNNKQTETKKGKNVERIDFQVYSRFSFLNFHPHPISEKKTTSVPTEDTFLMKNTSPVAPFHI